MIEFVNRNLVKTSPDYFYLVEEYVTTFEMDKGKNEPFWHDQKFEGKNLLKCRIDAEKYYWQRLIGLEQGRYFLEFAAPKDFKLGENAAYSLVLSLVEYYNEDNFMVHSLLGEDERTITESIEIEQAVLKEKGLL